MKVFNTQVKFGRYCLLLLLNLVVVGNALPQTVHWWNDVVFYEVFVRSYKDSDGDGKGDINGLIEKLDYLNDGDPTTHNDLGVTAIWLMPIQESPSYHGYDVIDYRTLEQDYGTNEEFKTFITEAHNRGIKVIIDFVMNHTSSQHPWFLDALDPSSAKRDWYIWQSTNPGNIGPWGQTVWHSRNGSYNYGIFWSEMPDLNYNTPAVKTEMFDIADFWLDEMGVDGFRLDAIKYIFEDGSILEDTPETIQFWRDFRTHYKSINGNAVAVGEAWTTTDKVAPYVNSDGLDYCFEFDLADAILNAANSSSVAALKAQMDEVIATYPHLQYGTFLTNHDINRVMNRLGSNTAKAKVAAELLLTLPGVPYIYYGEEIGMTGAKPDENIRKPLQWNSNAHAGFTTGTPWRAVNADYTTKNIAAQQKDASSLWSSYRRLIALRNNQAALRRGTYQSVTASSSTVYSFLRQYNNENCLVVCNTNGTTVTNVTLSLDPAGIAPGTYTLVELQGGDQLTVVVNANGGFTNLTISEIPARSTFIYKFFDPADVSTSVTFKVDMNPIITAGNFNPATESVDIVADFNGFGSGSVTTLTDIDNDGIYEVMVSGEDIGSNITYKYRMNGVNDGREEYPGSAYLRNYLVMEGSNTVSDIYQMQGVTGTKDRMKHTMSLYPVPADEEVFIDFSTLNAGVVEYSITDLTGTELLRSSFSQVGGMSGRISCEGLLPGVYFVNITSNGTSEVFRIVVQR